MNLEFAMWNVEKRKSGRGLPQSGTLARGTRARSAALLLGVLASLCMAQSIATAAEKSRVTESFDSNWQFLQSDPAGAETGSFDDSKWRTLDVPYDWSIAGPFAATNKTGGAGAFLPSGVAWYRKHFTVPKADANQRVWIEFDGVMQNSKVWINGVSLGERPYGYSSFRYDLTPYLKFGGANVVAVRCDTSAQPASRWYSGAGIYRHVRLVTANAIHVEPDGGLFVSTPEVASDKAVVRVETSLTNETKEARDLTVQASLISPEGKNVATVETKLTATNGVSTPLTQRMAISKPELWNLDSPKLYRVVVKVLAAETVLCRKHPARPLRES